MVKTVVHAVCRNLLQALDGRQHQGHFREDEGFAAENGEELETHGDEDGAHEEHAHQDYRHHLHLTTTATTACGKMMVLDFVIE